MMCQKVRLHAELGKQHHNGIPLGLTMLDQFSFYCGVLQGLKTPKDVDLLFYPELSFWMTFQTQEICFP